MIHGFYRSKGIKMINLVFLYFTNMEHANNLVNGQYFVAAVMKDDYLRTNILYNIDDIKDLIHVCSIDKKSQEICSQRYFWSLLFKKHNLPLPERNYCNTNEWIVIFNKIKQTDFKTREIINSLGNNDILMFNNMDEDILPIEKILTENNKLILHKYNKIKLEYPGKKIYYHITIGKCKGNKVFSIIYNIMRNIIPIKIEKMELYKIVYQIKLTLSLDINHLA